MQSVYMLFTIHNKNIFFLPTTVTIFIFTLIAWLENYYFLKDNSLYLASFPKSNMNANIYFYG